MERSTSPLSPQEAENLTIDLEHSFYGSDYDNADLIGSFAHFESSNWKYKFYLENPEPDDRRVEKQIDILQEVISPHIGRVVLGRTRFPVMGNPEDKIWRSVATDVLFTQGRIEGVEGRPALSSEWFEDDGSIKKIPDYRRDEGHFKIGVVINISDAAASTYYRVLPKHDPLESFRMNPQEEEFNHPLDLSSEFSRILIPIRYFPNRREFYNSSFCREDLRAPY